MKDDDRGPPRNIGDYPHGAYWSADPPPGYVESEDKEQHDLRDPVVLRDFWERRPRHASEADRLFARLQSKVSSHLKLVNRESRTR